MILLEAGDNGEVMIDELPYQRGEALPVWDKDGQRMGVSYNTGNREVICTMRSFSEYGTGSGAFGSFDDLVTFSRSAFFLDSSGVAVASPTSSAPNQLDKIIRLIQPGKYCNVPTHVSDGKGGTLVFYIEADNHFDRGAVIMRRTSNYRTFTSRQAILEDLDMTLLAGNPVARGWRDPGAGITRAGTIVLFATNYSYDPSNPGQWNLFNSVDVLRSTDNGDTWTLAQNITLADLPVSYGAACANTTMQELPDGSLTMAFYNGGVQYSWLMQSVDDGVTWTFKENIDDHTHGICQEPSHVYFPNSTLGVAFARVDGSLPKMFIRNAGGWVYGGDVANSTGHTLSSSCAISDDEKQVIVAFSNRDYLCVDVFHYNIADIKAAISGGLENTVAGSMQVEHRVSAMSSLRSKNNISANSNYKGHFGNPCLNRGGNDQLILTHYTLAPLQGPTYSGTDDVEVHIIVQPFEFTRSFIKAGTIAVADVAANMPAQIKIGDMALANGCFKKSGDDWVCIQDCYAEWSVNLQKNFTAGMGADSNNTLTAKVFDTLGNTKTLGVSSTYQEVSGQIPSLHLRFGGNFLAGDILRVFYANDGNYDFSVGYTEATYSGPSNGWDMHTVPMNRQMIKAGAINVQNAGNTPVQITIGAVGVNTGMFRQNGNDWVCIEDCFVTGNLTLQIYPTTAPGFGGSTQNLLEAQIIDAGDPAGAIQTIGHSNTWHKAGEYPTMRLHFASQFFPGDILRVFYTNINALTYNFGDPVQPADDGSSQGWEMFTV